MACPDPGSPPRRQIDAMILETKVKPVVKDQAPYKDYGTLYVAELRVDVSPERIAGFAQTYQPPAGPAGAWCFWAAPWRSS